MKASRAGVVVGAVDMVLVGESAVSREIEE